MTHDDLLSKIDEPDHWFKPFLDIRQALRAVVELHKPSGIFCQGCGFDEEYNEPAQLLPCPTIQAIEKELNGQA